MNKERPLNDQLELLPGGLLRHHCCYPNCLFYLQNLCTEEDIKTGKRNGLYKHLSRFLWPTNFYLKGLHLHSANLMRKKNVSEAQYIADILPKLSYTKYTGGEQAVRAKLKQHFAEYQKKYQNEEKKGK